MINPLLSQTRVMGYLGSSRITKPQLHSIGIMENSHSSFGSVYPKHLSFSLEQKVRLSRSTMPSVISNETAEKDRLTDRFSLLRDAKLSGKSKNKVCWVSVANMAVRPRRSR